MACRYVTYLRVSTQRQGLSGLGLESQRATVKQFAAANGCEILEEFVEVESGRKNDKKRPTLAAAIRRAQLSGATLLIARLDRLTRSVSFLCKLRDERVAFTACDFPDASQFTINILASVAEHEAVTISNNTKKGLFIARQRLEAKGRRLGSKVGTKAFAGENWKELDARQLGARLADYRAMGQKANAEKAQAHASRLATTIADIKAQGITTNAAIAAELTKRKIVTTMDAKRHTWHPTSVARLLTRLPQTAA